MSKVGLYDLVKLIYRISKVWGYNSNSGAKSYISVYSHFRYYNIAFYAYSPLGGGILTGKYKYEDDEEKTIVKGRFNGIGWDKVTALKYLI